MSHRPRRFSLCSEGISCGLVCNSFLSSSHWPPMRREFASFTVSSQISVCIDESHHLSRQNRPSFLRISSCERCFSTFTIFVAQHWFCFSRSLYFSLLRSPKLAPHSSCSLTSAEQRGGIASLDLLAVLDTRSSCVLFNSGAEEQWL